MGGGGGGVGGGGGGIGSDPFVALCRLVAGAGVMGAVCCHYRQGGNVRTREVDCALAGVGSDPFVALCR